DSRAAGDVATLQAAGLAVDGPGLLHFFRLRSRDDVSSAFLTERIEQLASDQATTRRQAAADLVGVGPPALPLLRQTVKDPDREESAVLARRCLQALEENATAVAGAAVRQLARQHPPGAVEALLTYLPFADEEM